MKPYLRIPSLILALLLALCAAGCGKAGPDPERHLEAARQKLEGAQALEAYLDADITLSAMGSSFSLTASADTVFFADPLARKTETRAALSGTLNEYAARYAVEEGEAVAVYTFRSAEGWTREEMDREEYPVLYPPPRAAALLTLATGERSGLSAAEDELRGVPVTRVEGMLAADASREVLLSYGLIDGLTSALDAEMAAAVAESVTEADKAIPAVLFLDGEDTLLRAELDLTPLMKPIVNKVLSYMGDTALAALVKVGDCTVSVDFEDAEDIDRFALPSGIFEP